MSLQLPMTQALRALTTDGRLLFGTRILRMFAYGLVSVVLVLYLTQLRLNMRQIGALLTFTLVGDTLISLWLTTHADRLGRRRMLLAGAALMLFAGLVFAVTHQYALLLIAATLGVISPSGNEVGPFLSIEQAALAQTVSGTERTQVFAWYNLMGSFAAAAGALCSGALTQLALRAGMEPLASYRLVILAYAALGGFLVLLFTVISAAIEVTPEPHKVAGKPDAARRFGLNRSAGVVIRLSALFALDAFGGGLVMQSVIAFWFHVRYGVEPALLGGIFFGANVLAGISALAAAWVARRIGLLNTMVFTHVPSNLFLILVPLMPNLPLAITMLLLRFSISQMDVPTRQSYTMAVVSPEERSAAAGVTGVARTIGAALAPLLVGPLLGVTSLLSVPFFLAGGLKLVYDALLYRSFRTAHLPEEASAQK